MTICTVYFTSQVDNIQQEIDSLNQTLNRYDIDNEIETIIGQVNDIPQIVVNSSREATDGKLLFDYVAERSDGRQQVRGLGQGTIVKLLENALKFFCAAVCCERTKHALQSLS